MPSTNQEIKEGMVVALFMVGAIALGELHNPIMVFLNGFGYGVVCGPWILRNVCKWERKLRSRR